MNFLTRLWLDNKLKRTLAPNRCRLDSGIRGLRGQVALTLENDVKLHDIKVFAPQVKIGAHTDIVSGSELHHVSEIGRYCSISSRVVIGQDPRSHPLDWISTSHAVIASRLNQQPEAQSQNAEYHTQPTTVGHDVWVGRDVIIMKGVTVGTGAVVGAQSLVNRDIPPYAIVAGSPAKIIRYRFDEPTRQALLESRWWDYQLEALGHLSIEEPAALLDYLKQGANLPAAKIDTVTVSSDPLRIV